MTREELKKSGLLDQYVLGLLGPEQAGEVERMLDGDPMLEAEVERLRRELNAYADARNIGPPPGGRTVRTARDFQDLDHEMITAMMERNHTLNIWRYVLVAICLLLVGLAGYLFRIKENYRGQLLREEALHAQDAVVYEFEMERSQEAVWDSLRNWHGFRLLEERLDSGTLRVHLPSNGKVALVDLSGVPAPKPDMAYYLFVGEPNGESEPVIVGRGQGEQGLHALSLHHGARYLRIYEWEAGLADYPVSSSRPVAELELPIR
jgi:hypothetical protein